MANFTREKTEERIYNILIKDSYIQYHIFIQILQDLNKESVEIVDIGSGLGIPSIPVVISLKNLFNEKNESVTSNILKVRLKNFKFTLIEPNQKRYNFLEKINKIMDLKLIVQNIDEKTFYAKYKKKFDIVFCRAVFPPPKIFDVFRRYTQGFAFWQYSERYRDVLLKYENKIKDSYLQVFKIFCYQIFDKEYYTVVFSYTNSSGNSSSRL